MNLRGSRAAWKIPLLGTCEEPHEADCEEFLRSISWEETRGVTQARGGSIHFPAIHNFALFTGRYLTGKHDLNTTCALF